MIIEINKLFNNNNFNNNNFNNNNNNKIKNKNNKIKNKNKKVNKMMILDFFCKKKSPYKKKIN